MKISIKQTDGTELNLECIYIVIHIDKKGFIISGVNQIKILKDAPEALQIKPESQSSITLQ